MSAYEFGKVLDGNTDELKRSFEFMQLMPVDQEIYAPPDFSPPFFQRTIRGLASVKGRGTFFRKAERTLLFMGKLSSGWEFDRQDNPDFFPIEVSVKNVWTTVRNIVLCSGSPHNYVRMVEHIIALKVGLFLDNLTIKLESGDPPLFERGSMDLVEAVENAEIVESAEPAVYANVKEPVSIIAPNGGFLIFLPPENGSKLLKIDCAVDFKSAIGKQRIKFDVTPLSFKHGAAARTNCSLWQMIFTKTIGKLFADIRNLGYTTKNILIAGPKRYFNEPKMIWNGKSLEAVWHRATLDLLAAVALIGNCRFAGKIISYKAGHTLDVQMIRLLQKRGLLERM